MTASKEDVVIIGAGIIGLACGHALLQEGRSVLWIDPNSPGSGASFGNAGTIADYAVLPVGSPAVLKQLPQLLFNSDSPLSIQPGAAFSLAPWLARFALQSLPGPMLRNIQAIAALTLDAGARWRSLALEINAESLFRDEGCLYVYQDATAFRKGSKEMQLRAKAGVDVAMLRPSELAELEPLWPAVAGGAAFFPDSTFVSDPGEVASKLALAGVRMGGRRRTETVTTLECGKDTVELKLSDGDCIKAGTVVIAAGAHSKFLADQAGDRMPLDTERGYHLEYDGQDGRVRRPVCVAAGGFYMTPMAGRLRVAGTVELGGLHPRPSPHRLAALSRGASHVFPDLGEAQRSWLGFRPSMPDSRPVLSQSSRTDRVIYAFGHGHIGLTLAPMTAAIVTALATKRCPPLDLSPYSARRFNRWFV